MKKIVIDGYFLMEQHPVGLHRFSAEILREWSRKYSCENICIAVPDDIKMDIDLSAFNLTKISTDIYRIPKIGMLLWKNFAYPKFIEKEEALSIDMAYAQQTKKCDVVGVFDCITEKYPENFSGFRERMGWRKNVYLIHKSAQKAGVVITLSEDAKQDIVRYTRINPDKVKIVPCGWEHINRIPFDDTIFDRLPDGYLKGNYFFSLGSRYKHKNIRWVLEAAKQNPKEHFIITGAKFGLSSDVEESLPNVYFSGYLSDSEIKSLMRYARALIQPSLYEGFGIPPMEALAVGTPVIVSNTSSLKEIYGGYAHLIDPYDYENINLDEILRHPVENPYKLLNRYTWSIAAEKYWGILEEL